jgi:hypothetical protein
MTQSRGQILLNPEVISNVAADGGAVILFEGSTNGENAITFKAPDVVTADYTFTLPDGTGTPGQALTTDGNGVTSWTTVTAASGGTSGQFQYNDGASGFAGLSTMTTDGTDITITGGAISTNSTIAIRDASFAATFQSPTYTANTTYTLPEEGTASAGAALIAASGSTVASTVLEWGTPSGTNQDPGGATGDVQFRGSTGLFTGEAAFNYDITTDILSVPTIDVTNIRVTGNTISSTNANGNINLDANGTGDVILSGGTDLTLNGSTSGDVTFSAGTSPTSLNITLPSAVPATTSKLQFTTGAATTSKFVSDIKTLNFVMDSGDPSTPAFVALGVRGTVYFAAAMSVTGWKLIGENGSASAFSINVNQASFPTPPAAPTYSTVITGASLGATDFTAEASVTPFTVAAGDILQFDVQSNAGQTNVTMSLIMTPL